MNLTGVPSRELLIYLNIHYKGSWSEIMKHISNREEIISAEEFYDVMSKIDPTDFVTLVDEDYPAELKSLIRPFFVLYRHDIPHLIELLKYVDRCGVLAMEIQSKEEEEKNSCDSVS